jgi:hypothetical protein
MTVATGARGGPTEAADLAAATAGDAEAFRRLTQRYQRELHLHCYRLRGTIQDAEDAVQETWLRAWRHLADFAGRSSFRAWLYRIATNACLTAAARHRDAPPPPAWLAGALAASREPVVAASMPMPGGRRYRATVLSVLSLDGGAIAAITAFPDRAHFPVFGLPTELDAAVASTASASSRSAPSDNRPSLGKWQEPTV